MGYITRNLDRSEKLIHETKLHWLIFSLPILTLIFAVYLYINNYWIWIPRFFLAIGIGHLIINLIRYFTNEFVVTTYNLKMRHGFFPSLKIIPLKQIDHIDSPSPYNPINIILKKGNMVCVTGANEKFVFRSVSAPREFANETIKQINNPQIENSNNDIQPAISKDKKEFWVFLPSFIQDFLARKNKINLNDPQIWGGFSDGRKYSLAYRGLITTDDPDEFTVFSMNKHGEMDRLSSFSEKTQFIQSQIVELEKEQDSKKKEQRIASIRSLFFDLGNNDNNNLSGSEKKQNYELSGGNYEILGSSDLHFDGVGWKYSVAK